MQDFQSQARQEWLKLRGGNKIDAFQADIREDARRVADLEIIGTIGLINHIGKACFIQGLCNERIQTMVRKIVDLPVPGNWNLTGRKRYSFGEKILPRLVMGPA